MSNALRFASVLLCSIVFTSGCAVIDSHTSTRVSGQVVGDDVLASVRPGITTESRLIEMLGEPGSVVENEDGSRQLNYHSKRVTRSKTELLFVIDSSSTKERVQTISFEVKDGVVTKVSHKTEGRSVDVDF
jgi:outer membrane protein assembly factor BamE (lipoprotein component of BamABCDE complex)